MTSSADKLAAIVADGLNEYADYIARDADVPSHRPTSPAYWFYGLAREQRALCRSVKFRRLLTPAARAALNARPSWWDRSQTARVNGIWRAVA